MVTYPFLNHETGCNDAFSLLWLLLEQDQSIAQLDAAVSASVRWLKWRANTFHGVMQR